MLHCHRNTIAQALVTVDGNSLNDREMASGGLFTMAWDEKNSKNTGF
jgi:hypothetical protein